MNETEAASLFSAALRLGAAAGADRPALGAYRPSQGKLFQLDPCRAHSERTCWACPLERCRRRLDVTADQ